MNAVYVLFKFCWDFNLNGYLILTDCVIMGLCVLGGGGLWGEEEETLRQKTLVGGGEEGRGGGAVFQPAIVLQLEKILTVQQRVLEHELGSFFFQWRGQVIFF